MNRYLATSLLATTTGAVLVFAAHGCALNPFAGYSKEEAQTELTGSSSSTSGGGAGGVGGAGSTGGAGGCMCTDDGNDCTDDLVGQACPGGDEKECHTVVANRNCTQNDGKQGYCDDAGACKSCDECSDAACMKRCNGQVCQTPDVCVSGNCVDGFCCDSDCTGPCNACNRVAGMCVPLPVGMAGECTGGMLCGNTSTCITPSGVALGALCNGGAACESGACVGQICVSLNGQSCVEDLECASRLCDLTTHKCVACGDSVMCPDGAACLPSGSCPALLGQPATNSNECKPPGLVNHMLTCTLPKDAACTNDFECIFHLCTVGVPQNKCAAACTIDAQCPLGTTCNKSRGWCRLPAGSYCVTDDQCQAPMNGVSTCAGFPRRCQ